MYSEAHPNVSRARPPSRRLLAIIEDAWRRARRRRATLAALLLVVAGTAVSMALFVFDGGHGGSTGTTSQSASSERNCFGLVGVAGEGDGSREIPVAAGSCGLISAEDLETHMTSRADWYAAHSPKMTVDGLRLGCDLTRADARMYLQTLGSTFTVEVLRNFRAACGPGADAVP